MDEVKITIIGAGVVGLSIAAELSRHYDEVIVLEKHDTFGQETSSRNSEVIHSGIYYPQGSLKAKLCVEGADQLYAICGKNAIPYRKTGKLIVATESSETHILEDLLIKGKRNNAKGIDILEKRDISRIEPNTNAVSALYSPNTGIIDSHSLMKHFYNTAQRQGVLFSFNSDVEVVNRKKDGYVVGIKQEGYKFRSRVIINCAGLSSDTVASLAGIDIDKSGYRLRLCKGSYFSYAKPSPVRTLVYPVPHEELVGLGVHATLDLGDRLRFGPDAEYIDSVDYTVDRKKRDVFFAGALKIIPGLEKDAFIPDMAGIRPKLQGPGEKTRDFIIAQETDRGLPGFINLIGIESPGLTASPAIAKMVTKMAADFI